MTSIFKFQDYKAYLSQVVRESDQRGFQSKLAAAAQCQPAYLSRVFHSKAHLTSEQAYGMAGFLKLSELESNYFLDLLSLGKTDSVELAQLIRRRLSEMKEKQERIESRHKITPIEDGALAGLYYSSWQWSAVHILITIPKYRTIAGISKRLNLSEDTVQETLVRLQNFGLVKRDGNSWKIGAAEIHLPKESMMIGMHHANWRHRAIMDAQNPKNDGLHYTAVQSHSRAVFEEIRQVMLTAIDRSRTILAPTPDEEVSCLTLDFFRI